MPNFVSTNDLVTSQFFQYVDCNLGIATIYFGGKVQDYFTTDAEKLLQLVFNYAYLICRSEDYASPHRIRSAISET